MLKLTSRAVNLRLDCPAGAGEAGPEGSSSLPEAPWETHSLDQAASDQYQLAVAYFQTRVRSTSSCGLSRQQLSLTPRRAVVQAYSQAAQALQDLPGTQALFLRCYAIYVSSERDREQAVAEAATPAAAAAASNKVLAWYAAAVKGLLRAHAG